MLGSMAYACNTWKQSTCCCLCQTNASTNISVLAQGLPNPVPSWAPALLLGTSFWQAPASQLLDCPVKQLLDSFCTSRAVGLQNSVSPIRKNHLCFFMEYTSLFCDSVVYSEAGKEKLEDSTTAIFTYLAFLPEYQRIAFRKRNWEQVWRSWYIMATAIYWLCCLKYTHLGAI